MIKKNKKYKKKFTIGYNGKKDFFEKAVKPFEYYISSVYSSPPTPFGIDMGRFRPGDSVKDFVDFRKKLKKKKIKFNLLFNFDGVTDINIAKKVLVATKVIKPDIVTINGTFFLDLFLKNTNCKINISVVTDVYLISQIDMLMERDKKGQIESLNISRRRVYDLDFIKKIKNKYPNLKLKLLINEGCVFGCPDVNFHSCSIGMAKNDNVKNYDAFYCQKLKKNQYWRFLTGQYIPPKFLSGYCGFVDEFKIAGRGAIKKGSPTGQQIKVIKEYIEERDVTIDRAIRSTYGGAHFSKNIKYNEFMKKQTKKSPYLKPYPKEFFDIRSKCRHNCDECGYCKNILKQ